MSRRDPKPWDEMTPFEKSAHAAMLRAEMRAMARAPRIRDDLRAIVRRIVEDPEFHVRPGTLAPGERCPRGCRGRR